MDVDLSQAKQLNNAFSPILPINLQWLPLRELKGMDDALKFQTALNLYSEWEEEKRQYWVKLVQGFKNSNLQTKILTLAMYCLVIYFLIAGFLNLPPVGFFRKGVLYAFLLKYLSSLFDRFVTGRVGDVVF